MNNLVSPIKATAIDEESLAFLETVDGDYTAELLYTPIDLKLTNNDGTTKYVEGVDYKIEGRLLTLLEKSSIPKFTLREYYGIDIPDDFRDLMKRYNLSILYTPTAYIFNKQCRASYNYISDRILPFETYNYNQLKKTKKLLEGGQPLKIIWDGDSISTGCDCSKMLNVAPYQPHLDRLVAEALEEKYGSKIDLDNTSVGGMSCRWSIDNKEERLLGKTADLVILGWGMNDATGKTNPLDFIDSIKELMGLFTDSEFLIINTMLPNVDCGYMSFHQSYGKFLRKLENENVAVVDMAELHQSMLERKKYLDMSSNNVNHPNDFFARVYAQNILTKLGFFK